MGNPLPQGLEKSWVFFLPLSHLVIPKDYGDGCSQSVFMMDQRRWKDDFKVEDDLTRGDGTSAKFQYLNSETETMVNSTRRSEQLFLKRRRMD